MPENQTVHTRPGSTRAVLVGGVVSGLSAYAFTILGARVLGEVSYAPVGVLWTIQYLVLTVGLLSPEAFITREGAVPGTVIRWTAGLTVALVAVAALAGARLFGSAAPVWPVAVGGIGAGFSLFVAARGLSASRGDYHHYGTMTGGESATRLLVAAVVLWVTPTAQALALTLPVGALAMAALWQLRWRHQAADAAQPPDPVTGLATGRFLIATTAANAVAQVLLAGGPLLTAALDARPELTSQVFVTTTAARAPLVLLYSGLLARLLGVVTALPRPVLRRRVVQGAVAVVAIAGVAAVIGAAIGPWLVEVAFGAGLRPSPTFAALTAAAVILAIGLLAANQVLIARHASDRLVVPWTAAVLAGAAVIGLADLPPDLLAGTTTLVGLGVAGVAVLPQVLAEVGHPAAQRL